MASKPKRRKKVRRPDDEARRQSKKRKRTLQYNERELDNMAPEDGQYQFFLEVSVLILHL